MRHAALLATLLCASAHAADFGACLSSLQPLAAAQGVSARTYLAATAALEPDRTVLDALDSQPEFKTPIWDYFAALVDDERIADGRARLAEWEPVLARAEREYGVERQTIVAIWGVESDYGRITGKRPLLQSLATLSCAGRRQAYFRGEFIAALRILQSGDVPAAALSGSWAGAFGHTQFMPSTFLRVAVDFDGDGRRDIVGSVPDVIGSTANFLARAGWTAGEKWGYEVRVPRDYAGTSGRRNRQALAAWTASGLRRIDGSALGGSGSAALLLPAGSKGPAFLVFRNFNALHSYNPAESYGLAIAHLSDRLLGAGGIAAPWPTDDRGLSRAERRELQQLLLARGYEIGAVDGGIGPLSRAAIRGFEASAGWPETGRAGGKVFDALRSR